MSDHTRADEGEGREPTFQTDEATRALIADLERELGAKGTADVFRKALAIAREASQTGEHSGFSGVGIRSVIGSRKDIDLVQRWCQQVGAIPYLQERIKATEAEVARLTAENERLLIAFHDATRRPLGVTPDSGAEFYDQRMADEAEERRVARSRQTVLRGLSREEAEARAAALGDAQRREHAARTALEAPHDGK